MGINEHDRADVITNSVNPDLDLHNLPRQICLTQTSKKTEEHISIIEMKMSKSKKLRRL